MISNEQQKQVCLILLIKVIENEHQEMPAFS